MKLIISSIVLPFFLAGNALAAEALPNYLRDKLRESSEGTALQLMVNDTVEQINKDGNFRDDVSKKIARDLNGWEPYAKVGAGASAVLTVAGSAGMGAGSIMDGAETAQSLQRVGIHTGGGVSAVGVASSVVGLLGYLELDGKLLHESKRQNLLNETEADRFAGNASRNLGRMYQLSKGKEAALKFAIKEEIYRKDKAGDHTELDLPKVMKSTKHMGKEVFSPKELEAFVELQTELKKAPAQKPKALSDDERIGFLLGANSMLEVQNQMLEKTNGKTEYRIKIAAQIAQNSRVLKEIREFRSSQDPDSVKKEEGEKAEGNTDAE